MIAKIKGNIDFLRDNYVVIDVNGIGYKIFVSPYTFGKLAGEEEIELFTHTYVREDALSLYGFFSLEELEMFELLISISGIGPKAALGILSIADPVAIRTAVQNEDPSILTRVSGVGKKTAERVILELKNKVAGLPVGQSKQVQTDADALEALISLGYSVSEAREALKHVPKDVMDVSERVKTAMRNLGKK